MAASKVAVDAVETADTTSTAFTVFPSKIMDKLLSDVLAELSVHAELRAHPRRSTWCEFSSYSLIPV